MSLLELYVPRPSLRQVHRVAVASSAAHAYASVRQVDLFTIGFARTLFALRLVPERLASWLRGRPRPPAPSSRIDDITAGESGFRILAETGREIVVGAVGKVWAMRIPFVDVRPDEFAAFSAPGYAQVAWSLRVDPRDEGGAWITFELRVRTTDAASWPRFLRYWAVIGRFSHLIREALMRQFIHQLGAATPPEDRAMPGDHLLASARFQNTREVVIEAPPVAVWPWLVQMGGRRAGWYSWDLFDNGGTPSAHRIHPELQLLEVGDLIPALPWTRGGFGVLELEPGRSLVLGDPSLLPDGRRDGGSSWRTTWAFDLEPIGDDATRLAVRVRADFEPAPKMTVLRPLMSALHGVMERRQLHNLKQRAEGTWR